MDQKIDVSVVVPTYNEAENLPLLIRRLARALRGRRWEVVVVDDGSPDGTGRVAETLARRYPVKLVQRGKKSGLSSAVVEGWQHARGGVLVMMDADLQHPPELVSLLVREVEKEKDLAIATRVRWEGWRGKVSRLASTFIRLFLVPEVRDPHSGFFAFRREAIKGIKVKPRGYKLLLELLVKRKYKISELPYFSSKRRWGKSKWGPREMWEYLLQVISCVGFVSAGRTRGGSVLECSRFGKILGVGGGERK